MQGVGGVAVGGGYMGGPSKKNRGKKKNVQGVGGRRQVGGTWGGPYKNKWGSNFIFIFDSYPEGPKGPPGGRRSPALRRS